MIISYTTLASVKEVKIEVKKSVFIASIKPVNTELEAKEYINEITKKYNDARHNVPVYRVVSNDNRLIESYSDNGEPKGTAGMPILDILRGRDLVNVCLVVTRYFGGILLGTGGLVKAYGDAAKEVLSLCELIKKEMYDSYEVVCDYNYFEKIKNKLAINEIELNNIKYTDKISFMIYVSSNQNIDNIRQVITDETNNKYEINLKQKNIFK